MQFAGQRTDMDLKPVGEPVNLMVKLGDDVLPSPYAILTTGITPQMTQADGLTEAELARYLCKEIFAEDTVAVGYNNVRFDDEFMRYLFWRSFHDPYEWAWKDGRSRWDMLDVVRMTRALRPDGIKWPVDKDGKATNRLELITKANKIGHEKAHDAMSDVEALMDVARLLREKQGKLFDYLFAMRNKKEVQKLVNLDEKKEFVYVSGRYETEYEKATVAFPLTSGRNGNVVVYDLRYSPEKLAGMGKKELKEFLFERWSYSHDAFSKSSTQSEQSAQGDISMLDKSSGDSVATAASSELRARMVNDFKKGHESSLPRSVIKELKYGHCPAVAPVGVLEQENGWEKIGLTMEQVQKNKKELLAHPEFAELVRELYEERPEFENKGYAEARLYEGFLNDSDRVRVEAVRNADEKKLADFHPEFADERLPELLLHYKGRNYPKSLSSDEMIAWETWREEQVREQLPGFAAEMEKLAGSADGAEKQYLLQELQLWCENIAPMDY